MIAKHLDRLKSQYLSKRIIFFADQILSLLASLIVLLIFGLLISRHALAGRFFLTYLVTAVLGTGLMSYLMRSYRIVIRHLVVRDIVVFAAVSLGKTLLISFVLVILGYRFRDFFLVPAFDFFLTFFMLVGVRLMMILVYEMYNRKIRERVERQRILVYETAEKSLATLLRLHSSSHYEVVGFVIRGRITSDLTIERLPVYPFESERDFADIVRRSGAAAILFARDTDARKEEDGLIRWCSSRQIRTLIVPNLDEVKEGETIFKPRAVKVEDLLGRNEIKVSLDEIRANFNDKVVLVTGAAGSIGSELVRQLAGFGVKKIILFDNAETPMHYLRLELEDKFPDLEFVPIIGDLRQVPRLDYAFRTYRPQVVFHAAAYKHVPLMEENPCEAIMVNTWGTRSVADRCIEYDVEKMVMISTDKAVNPTNIMGCTKRLAEIYVQSLGLAIERGEHTGKTQFVTTRFGNVLGSNGSVIPRFREQIAKGGPVTVTHPDINRFFMTIPEACRLVMEAATMSTGNQIFVFDMGEPVKIDTLARRMITLAGFTPDKDIKIEYTGLRPGEKLYEEVLSDKENTLPTFHERIRIAKVREYQYADMVPIFSKLHHLAEVVDIEPMVRLMKETVPEFKSANSKFAALDK